jgi:arylformamidase
MTPLEIEYSPSSRVASLDHELQVYAAAGERVRAGAHRVVPYGDHPDEWAVVVDAAPGAPLHLFVHGGYWQALSAWDGLSMVPDLSAAGVSVASINYTLAPSATIGEMIEQCRRGFDAVVAATEPRGVTLSGSSAGAHLAAHVALRRQGVDRLFLLSGVYDLGPLVQTYVNEPLGLTHESAAAWSVPFDERPAAAVTVVHGDNETDAFKAQSRRLAEAWDAPLVEVPGRHHFDLVAELPRLHLRA